MSNIASTGKLLCNKVAVIFVLATIMLFSASMSAWGLEPAEKWEGSINYAATGGSFLIDTCQAYANIYTGDEGCNPGILDGQGDTMVEQSSAVLHGIPDGVHIVKAILVWMGSINLHEQEPDNIVHIRPPEGFSTPVFAEDSQLQEIIVDEANIIPLHWFTYRVDVTEIIRRHYTTDHLPINGEYTISGFDGSADDFYRTRTLALGGWSLIIVYSQASAQPKRVYYYTDFRNIQADVVEFRPSGFEVPEDPEAKVTFFLGEGDDAFRGPYTDEQGVTHNEELRFNDVVLSDECNPADNAYNSTVNTNILPSERPCRTFVHSIDLDTFDVSHLLEKGDETATVDWSLGGDSIHTNYMILAINTKLPDFDIPGEPEKTASVPSGHALFPGQEFTYYIHVQNNGDDDARDVRVRDSLPPDVTYIPGSTVVVKPDGTRREVQDVQGNQPPCLTGIEIAEVLPIGPSHRYTVEIGVRLNTLEEGVSKETIVSNTGEIISNNGDVYFTNGGVPVQHTVQLEAYEGTLNFQKGRRHPTSRFVLAGDNSVIAAHLELLATGGNVRPSSFKFTPVEDELYDPTVIDSAALYLDNNGDGQLDDGDELMGETGWSVDGLVFADFSTLPEIEVNTSANLILVVDIGDAAPGSMAQIELVEDGVSIRGFVSGLPFQSAVLHVPAVDTQVSIEVGDNNPPDSYLSQGETTAVLQLKVRAYLPGIKIFGLSLSSEGSVHDPSEVTRLRLIHDVNGSGWGEPGEMQLGMETTFSDDNGSVHFSGFNIAVEEGDSTNLLLVATFSENIGEDKKFRVLINNDEQLDAGIHNVDGAPIIGNLFTFVSGEVVECHNDLECSMAMGQGWICDQVEGICLYSSSPTDGDVGPVDGDTETVVPDIKHPEIPEEGSGGGCGSLPASAGMLLLTILMAGAFMLRRRTSRNQAN